MKSYTLVSCTSLRKKLYGGLRYAQQKKRTNRSAEMLRFATRWHQLGFGLNVSAPPLKSYDARICPKLAAPFCANVRCAAGGTMGRDRA